MKKNAICLFLLSSLFLLSCGGNSASSSTSAVTSSESISSESESATSESEPDVNTKTLTGTFSDDWALSDSPVFFAWAWGGEISGQYYSALVEENTLTIIVDNEITGLKIQRFAPDGSLPQEGDTTYIEECWNATSDIDVSASLTFDITFITGY